MSSVKGNSTTYRGYIDGLRAVAVLAVLFYHADIGFPGGYVGVDVFFVISGYLITGLILKEIDGGHFHIVEFWERRMRRILPALTAVVGFSLVAGWFLLMPRDFQKLGQSASAQAMLLANVYFWRESGYFAQAAEVKPLLHTWSLAVEEQFYLLFPLFLIGLKRFSRASLVVALGVLSAISFDLSVYCSYMYPSENFYFLPTRAWELMIGSILAAFPGQRAFGRTTTELTSWGGFIAVLCAVFFYDSKTRFPGATAALPCVGTAFVIWSNSRRLTSLGALLSMRPVVFIGLISYSLYLWHWPVLVYSKYWSLGDVSVRNRVVLLLISAVLAIFSWKFVETPFRKRKLLKSRRQIFRLAGVVTVLLFVSGLTIHASGGFPSRMPPAVQEYANAVGDHDYPRGVELKQAQAGDFPEIGSGDKGRPIDLLVWGDSHAMAAMPVLDLLCREHSVRGVSATHLATAPLKGYKSDNRNSPKDDGTAFNSAVLEFIHAKHIPDVVLIARWGGYIETDKGTARLRSGILATMDALQDAGTRIWILRQVPEHPRDVPRDLATAVFNRRDPNKLGLSLAEHLEAYHRQDTLFEGLSERYPNVVVLNPTDLFVNSFGRCRIALDGKALYRDKDHLTPPGAMVLRPLFEPIFLALNESGREHAVAGSGK